MQKAIDSPTPKQFDAVTYENSKWRELSSYYFQDIKNYLQFLILPNSSVLEIGSRTGEVLASLKCARGLGVDAGESAVRLAKRKFPNLEFRVANYENLNISETFDYVVVSDAIGYVNDVQSVFSELRKVCRPDTRVIVTYFNCLWTPILKIAEMLGLRMKRPVQHWLPLDEIENLLELNHFEVIKKSYRMLCPVRIPIISAFLNRFVANLPFFWKMCINEIVIARPIIQQPPNDISCSVVIPCRNEKGNIQSAIERTPQFTEKIEFLFVEGHSKDGTLEECYRVQKMYPDKDIKVLVQKGAGKGDAVHLGFREAGGEVLMILDADLTVPPEDLPKFYNAIVEGKGEFINGSRMVYQMEKEAMRFLNLLGNKFFSWAFSYILEQKIRDTLCGTKVLRKSDYEKIVRGRSYFGDFDPFGDFDLLFGAAKLNLKIIGIPIHYKERTYGSTQIRRFYHGWLLLRMTLFAILKLKFI